jgi:hypothetical protein
MPSIEEQRIESNEELNEMLKNFDEIILNKRKEQENIIKEIKIIDDKISSLHNLKNELNKK